MPQPVANMTYESVAEAANAAFPWDPAMANAAIEVGSGNLAYTPRLQYNKAARLGIETTVPINSPPGPVKPQDPYPTGGGKLGSVAIDGSVPTPYLGQFPLLVDAGPQLKSMAAYFVPAGAALDKAVHQRMTKQVVPGIAGQKVVIGDASVINLFAFNPSIGRQWSQAAGQYTHANNNLDNRVMTSLDGINWHGGTVPTDASPQTWASVCWSPELNLFAALASGGGTPTTARVMTSPDGLTWTIRTAAQAHAWQTICWGGQAGQKRFVAVSSTTSVNHIMTSDDGITWTTRVTGSYSGALRGVCWSPDLNLFCAVGSATAGQRVLTSPDGITWTVQNTPADLTWQAVCWAGAPVSKFVAVASGGTGGNDGRVMTSPDGVTWTQQPVDATFNANAWTNICWSPEQACLVACSSSGGNRIGRSTDGINWTTHSGANISLQQVGWIKELGLFVAVGASGAARVYTSSNGTIWNARFNAPSSSAWYGGAWSPKLGKLVSIANSNSINPELVSWAGLGLKAGDKIRFSFTLLSGTVNFQYSNPGRVLSGAAYSTPELKLLQQILAEDADSFGLCAATDVAASFSAMTGYRETPLCAPRSLAWDIHVFGVDAAGVEDAAGTKYSNILIV